MDIPAGSIKIDQKDILRRVMNGEESIKDGAPGRGEVLRVLCYRYVGESGT